MFSCEETVNGRHLSSLVHPSPISQLVISDPHQEASEVEFAPATLVVFKNNRTFFGDSTGRYCIARLFASTGGLMASKCCTKRAMMKDICVRLSCLLNHQYGCHETIVVLEDTYRPTQMRGPAPNGAKSGPSLRPIQRSGFHSLRGQNISILSRIIIESAISTTYHASSPHVSLRRCIRNTLQVNVVPFGTATGAEPS